MIVKLPANTPIDLYAATGVTVGNVISITNVTESDVKVYESDTGDYLMLSNNGDIAMTQYGATGAYAFCMSHGAVQVEELTSV